MNPHTLTGNRLILLILAGLLACPGTAFAQYVKFPSDFAARVLGSEGFGASDVPDIPEGRAIPSPIPKLNSLNLGSFTPADPKRTEELIRQTKEYRAGNPRPSMKFLEENVINVVQFQAAVTGPRPGTERYLQTYGASTCIIVTIHDAESKAASLAHIDFGADSDASISQMLKKMGYQKGHSATAEVIGGYRGISFSQVVLLVESLERHGVTVREVQTKDEFQRVGDKIILDSWTGQIYEMEGNLVLTPEEQKEWDFAVSLARQRNQPVRFKVAGLLRR
ncbi:MAG: hypothetical protein COB53_10430 [Elusimicrobia bacterium]|nr:MAG: hypothetical protein COB53_10430 [Elusimicrobiota bacterium]